MSVKSCRRQLATSSAMTCTHAHTRARHWGRACAWHLACIAAGVWNGSIWAGCCGVRQERRPRVWAARPRLRLRTALEAARTSPCSFKNAVRCRCPWQAQADTPCVPRCQRGAGQRRPRPRTWPPRLRRCALGTTSFISFANCVSRLLGSLEVVTSTCSALLPQRGSGAREARRWWQAGGQPPPCKLGSGSCAASCGA